MHLKEKSTACHHLHKLAAIVLSISKLSAEGNISSIRTKMAEVLNFPTQQSLFFAAQTNYDMSETGKKRLMNCLLAW
jgi:hypothetical protein